MKKWYSSLNIYFKVTFWTFIVNVILILACIPCYFSGLNDIPQGFMLGGLLSIFFYLIQGMLDNGSSERNKNIGSIVIMCIRLLVFIALLILVCYLFYKANLKVFNVFSYTGGYLIGVIVLCLLHVVRKKKDDSLKN